jgi:hypothetical protein
MKGESKGKALTSVSGVDKDLAKRMNNAGIKSAGDLANASSEKLGEIGYTGRDAAKHARQNYDAKEGKGAFDKLDGAKKGGLIADQQKNWKTNLHNTAVDAVRADNPFHQDLARDLGVSLEDADALKKGGVDTSYVGIANANPEDFVNTAQAAGAAGITMGNIGQIQENAGKTVEAIASGIGLGGAAGAAAIATAEGTRPEKDEKKAQEADKRTFERERDEGIVAGASGTEAEPKGDVSSSQAGTGAKPVDMDKEGLWMDLKQQMMHMGGGRGRRHKSAGQHLEEMLEDRDETPSK